MTMTVAYMLAAFISAALSLSRTEEVASHLSVDTYDIPEFILEQSSSFYVEGECTVSGDGQSAISLEAKLSEELNSDGAGFISVKITRLDSGHGTLRLVFPALPSGIETRTVILETGNDTHTIVQTCPQTLEYALNPAGQKFPSDSQTITVSGGIAGAKYYMSKDNTVISSTGKMCDGNAIVFGPFTDVGEYDAYNDVIGHAANSVTVENYDIFTPEAIPIGREPENMHLEIPAAGGVFSETAVCSVELDSALYDSIAAKMNTIGIPGKWNPLEGIDVKLEVFDRCSLKVTFICEPRFKDTVLSMDTGFYLGETCSTMTVAQKGDSRAALSSQTLSWKWVDRDNATFVMSLSGSQPGVSYHLEKNGRTIAVMDGNGYQLSFPPLSGAESFGDYVVTGWFKGKAMHTETVRMTRDDFPDGDNFIAVRRYLDERGDSSMVDISYYDWLGSLSQTVAVHGSGKGQSLISPVVYDSMRRKDARTYLPFVSAGSGAAFVDDGVELQSAYYASTDKYPFRDRIYEGGISGRLISETREGREYHENSIRSMISYSIEDGLGGVLRLEYQYPEGTGAGAVRKTGTWPSGSLSIMRLINEDKDTSYVYSDAGGRTIMTRAVDSGRNHDTYRVYDFKDSLICVIQPEGTESIGDGFSMDSRLAQEQCFTWRYDAWGNAVETHVPGGGVVQTVFDMRNRPVLWSDNGMRNRNIWRYTIYDGLNRTEEEGECSLDGNFEDIRVKMQSEIDISKYISYRQPARQVEYWTAGTIDNGFLPVLPGITMSKEGCLTLPYRERLFQAAQTGPQKIIDRYFYYDRLGRLVETVENSSTGEQGISASLYDFNGNVTAVFEGHSTDGKKYATTTKYGYDDRGRKTLMRRMTDDEGHADVSYAYDDLGRLEHKSTGKTVEERLAYNLQGRHTETDASLNGEKVFSQEQEYMSGDNGDAIRAAGNRVSSIKTRRNGNAASRTETYSYDHLGRLTGTSSGRQDTNLEKNLRYDMNGNIVSMSRVIGEEPHSLEFMNTGNHTAGIFDRTSGGHTRYLHDEDGRLVYSADIDSSGNGIRYDFQYNSQGLVEKVTRNDSLLVEYSYLSDGTRTETRMKDGTVFRYRGNFVFRTDPDGKTELESIACDGGRLIPEYRNGKLVLMRDIRYVCDDLGSVRTVVDITGGDTPVRVLEENDYMAFGTRFSPSETSPQMADNRYRYNGKESQSFTGLPYIDYGARMYDPYAACWNTTDPLASRYFDIGPHVFCADNPINVIDPDGKSWYYSTSGDFIRHIKDKDDAIYIITDQQVEASALKERKLKSYRTDDNMFGRMLDKDFPNDIATKIFADLFDKANRTVENGNDKIVDCKYSIIVEEKKEKASEYAETKKESKKLIINLAATWYKGYDVISVFAHEMGHMIDDVNLPTRKDEERRAAAERFADEKAMEHWSFLKISNKAIEDLESHYITNGGTL